MFLIDEEGDIGLALDQIKENDLRAALRKKLRLDPQPILGQR